MSVPPPAPIFNPAPASALGDLGGLVVDTPALVEAATASPPFAECIMRGGELGGEKCFLLSIPTNPFQPCKLGQIKMGEMT